MGLCGSGGAAVEIPCERRASTAQTHIHILGHGCLLHTEVGFHSFLRGRLRACGIEEPALNEAVVFPVHLCGDEVVNVALVGAPCELLLRTCVVRPLAAYRNEGDVVGIDGPVGRDI